MRANSWDLTRCEKRSYDLLIKLEKEIQWEQLLKRKTEAFIAEQDDAVVWENPHLNPDYAKQIINEHYKQKQKGEVNESFIAI